MDEPKSKSQSDTKPETKPAVQPEPPASAPLTVWPGAFGAFGPSREAVRRNLKTIVLLIVLDFAVSIIMSIIFGRVEWLNDIISTLVGTVFTGAQILAFIASVRGRKVELGETLTDALPLVLKLFVLNVLVGLSVVLGLILFIIPGLIILPRLVLAPYFLMDKNLGILEAFQTSWNVTKGNSGKVWGIIGVTILMLLPVITVIGIIASAYLVVMYAAATALLYQLLLDHKPAAAVKSADAQPAAE